MKAGTLDQNLYKEYLPLRDQYEFADKFCLWVESGCKRKRPPEYAQASEVCQRLHNGGEEVQSIAKRVGCGKDVIGCLIRQNTTQISMNAVKRVIRALTEES